MKVRRTTKREGNAAYALATVMVMAGVSLTMYAGLARLSSTSLTINERNNVYNSSVAAAEAASERALSYLARDFLNQSFDAASLDGYCNLIPTAPWAAGYRFGDNAGGVNRISVSSSPTMVVKSLNSQFEGLYGLVYDCTVKSSAKPLNTPYDMTAAVQQDVQLASIPVFQFAIFYSMDMEINPGADMQVTGKVHSNAKIFSAPPASLRFCDDVTAVGCITNSRAVGDPTGGSKTVPIFDKEHMENASSLTLPIATNNSPAAVQAILDVPPFSEDPHSQVGQERYYNKTDLIITTTSSNVVLQAGNWNAFNYIGCDVPATKTTPEHYSFIATNNTFYDSRELKNTLLTEIDVAALKTWMTAYGKTCNDLAQFQMGHQINSIYVKDLRPAAGKLPAVRIINGQSLPDDGLTVATALPLYVEGHYNAPITTPGSTNTLTTKPASLVADSVTLLSGTWVDSNSTSALSARLPSDTTVNAAILAGIVQTTNVGGGRYSGGVENFPRFLENWSGKTLTYNGSMVVLFPSRYATNYWAYGGYYTAPKRSWAFDLNFLDYRKLPPATPQVRKLVRGQWKTIAAAGK